MASITSFYYAIFKRLQYVAGGDNSEHINPPDPTQLSGGFSLRSTQDPNGIFGTLSAARLNYTFEYPDLADQNLMPLSGNGDPQQTPLYRLLAAFPGADLSATVNVGGVNWPVMPQNYPVPAAAWAGVAAGSPKLVDKLKEWVQAGKNDDAPKDGVIKFENLSQLAPNPFPVNPPPAESTPILFVSSMWKDDGRRAGDGASPVVMANHVPDKFWATSEIYLTDTNGNRIYPPSLSPSLSNGQGEGYIAAVIGNAGNYGSGRMWGQTCWALCFAQVFSTNEAPAVPLPSLGNLDPDVSDQLYEELYIPKLSYDVIGFRFNVQSVFNGLAKQIDQTANFDLGGWPNAQKWLEHNHACVKVQLIAGEPPGANSFPPPGPLTLGTSPQKNRHIGQKNLVPFDMSLVAAKKPAWKNFIVSQTGAGVNALDVQLELPPGLEAQVFIAAPSRVYRAYIEATGHEGGHDGGKPGAAPRGFEVVHDLESRPFPDCVILRQTTPGAVLQIAEHVREHFLGLSLGIAGDPRAWRNGRPGAISVVHTCHDRSIAGGFTLLTGTLP
jgi:hypothetical protein